MAKRKMSDCAWNIVFQTYGIVLSIKYSVKTHTFIMIPVHLCRIYIITFVFCFSTHKQNWNKFVIFAKITNKSSKITSCTNPSKSALLYGCQQGTAPEQIKTRKRGKQNGIRNRCINRFRSSSPYRSYRLLLISRIKIYRKEKT